MHKLIMYFAANSPLFFYIFAFYFAHAHTEVNGRLSIREGILLIFIRIFYFFIYIFFLLFANTCFMHCILGALFRANGRKSCLNA